MNKTLKQVGLPLGIILIAIIVAVVMVKSRKPPEKVEVEQQPLLVDVIPVTKQDLNYVVRSQGTVLPRAQTVLSSEVNGKIVSLSDNFIAGGMFNKGDILIRLEQADYVTDLKAAEAELARAQAALEEEQARGKVAEQEWRSVSPNKIPGLGLRKPQLAQEQANVRAAEARVERAQRNLERTLIRAPYDGLVREKNVDVGQYVGIGSQLGTLFGTDVAEVRMPLSDNDLAYLELPEVAGDTHALVTLSADVAGQSRQWQGRLIRSEGVLDSSSRVIYAIAEIIDPYNLHSESDNIALKFGRFVQTEIIGNRGEGLVVLPRSLLRLDGTVMVVDEERKLRIRDVQVQRADNNNVYISSGLAAGELVTATAIPNPVDGMAVRISADEQTTLAKAGN